MFDSKFKEFYIYTNFFNYINSRALISNRTIFYSNSKPKIPKSGICGPKFKDLSFLHLPQSLQFGKFEGTGLNYDNSFFKFHSKVTPIRHFWFLNLIIFIFAWNFSFRNILRFWFQIWRWVFQIPTQNCTNKPIFLLIISVFIFAWTSHIEKFKGTDFQNGYSFFQIPAEKCPNMIFSVKSEKLFHFTWIFVWP